MGGRVVEGTGLENRQTRKRLEGSNPSPSAILHANIRIDKLFFSGDEFVHPSTHPLIKLWQSLP